MIDNNLIEARTMNIRWLFQLVRLAAVVWAGWHMVRFAMVWANRDGFLDNLGRALNTDLSNANFALGYSTGFIPLIALCLLTLTIWRLFSQFIAGRFFTIETAWWVRMVGLAGFVTVLLDLAHRPLMFAAFQPGLLAKVPLALFFTADDLLHLMLAGMVYAFGCILGSAAASQIGSAAPSPA